jgi:homoserine O-acetyltransferase
MAFDVVARNAIMSDPAFRDGQYYDGGPTPDTGLAIARMLGHITYLSPESMRQKFGQDRNSPRQIETVFEKDFSVGTYLAYQGEKFVERFDANSYVTLSRSMDLFDLGEDPRRLADALRHSRCRWLVVSFTSDWLFPAWQSEQIVTALIASDKPVSYCNIASDCGHDAFLLPDEVDRYGRLVRHFLAHLSGNGKAAAAAADTPVRQDPLSIFHTGRLDHDRVLKLIPPQASVLDLGCGDGTLLAALKRASHFPVVGVELDERAVISCVAKGVDCIHDDLNKGLKRFSDRQFDVVVLSWTLQAVLDVEGLLDDMLRVGRQCIVTFPNFGYHKLRTMLAERGRAPEGDRVFPHKWYNTPNLRFFTVLDFEELCSEKGVHIHKRLGLDLQRGCEVTDDVNRNADMAIFVISR